MKKYISNGREYMIFLNVGKTRQCVRFHDMGKFMNKGVFVTSDEALQNALEEHPRFGQCYYLEEETQEDTPLVETRKYDYTYPVKRTQDAIRILIEQHGIVEGSLTKKADVLAKADELNISFPNL